MYNRPNYKGFWKKWFEEKNLYEQINRPEIRYNTIRKYIKGKNVLDFGYGTGFFIKKLLQEGFNVTGIDFFKNIKVQKRKRLTLISLRNINDLFLLSFKEKFDTIIASEVIEHLNKGETNKVLKFFYNWLSEDGKLIITVPYREKINIYKLLCPYCLKWFHPWLHKQAFDEISIEKLLKKYGFVTEKISYITFIEFINIPLFLRHFLNFIISTFSLRGKIYIVTISKKE